VTERSNAPSIAGLFEAHLGVSDIERSIEFYRDLLGLDLAHVTEDSSAAFLWLGHGRDSVIGLWATGRSPNRLSLHIAFQVTLADVLRACGFLRSRGVTPLSFFEEETDEPSVISWLPAAVVYFRDPDGHLLEYVAMLDEAPDRERGITTWSEWTSRS
jgi:lactoylglutathione lyase